MCVTLTLYGCKLNLETSQTGWLWCIMLSETFTFTQCSCLLLSLSGSLPPLLPSLFFYPSSELPPLLPLLFPSRLFSGSMSQVTEGSCALERAAGAVNISLLVVCITFSANMEASPSEWRLNCELGRGGWGCFASETEQKSKKGENWMSPEPFLFTLNI